MEVDQEEEEEEKYELTGLATAHLLGQAELATHKQNGCSEPTAMARHKQTDRASELFFSA